MEFQDRKEGKSQSYENNHTMFRSEVYTLEADTQTDDYGTLEADDRVIDFEWLNSCFGKQRIPLWYCPWKALPGKPQLLTAPVDRVTHAGFVIARTEVPAKGAQHIHRYFRAGRINVPVEETGHAIMKKLARGAERATGVDTPTRGRHLPCRVPSQLELKHAINRLPMK